ncbi:MAG: GHMP family kinase ATP-binding protein [Candidatus Kariarchaeaceae archaeon]|jgi:pantoate kinase
MSTKSWAPGHTTLFFAVPNTFENYEEMGSIGGGLNFESGVITSISKSRETLVLWNDAQINGQVTKTVVKLFENLIKQKIKVRVNHQSNLMTGYGFSTSGAGAIGTALGLNQLYKLDMDEIELFELAHKAEVMNHTGLGSVVGQITGGMEIRLTQGGPRLCETISISSASELLIGFIGPLSTKDVLTSAQQMKLVTKSGIESVEKVRSKSDLSLSEMIKTGREFMKSCGLMTDKIREIIGQLDSIGEERVTMAMIGEALIIDPVDVDTVKNLLGENHIAYLETKITNKLPYIIS